MLEMLSTAPLVTTSETATRTEIFIDFAMTLLLAVVLGRILFNFV